MAATRNTQINHWFSDYGKRLTRFVQSRIADLDDAEDLAQDVWLQLLRQTDLDSIEQVSSWLFAAARNRIIDYYRKRKNTPFSALQTTDDDDENDPDNNLSFNNWATDALPDTLLESKEFWEILDRALADLPDEQREVFIAHELYDLSFKEIAAQTGEPVNTLLSRKRYAVLALRKKFKSLTP
jgi:RNA polymerase sigma factor (sigma-70 family)